MGFHTAVIAAGRTIRNPKIKPTSDSTRSIELSVKLAPNPMRKATIPQAIPIVSTVVVSVSFSSLRIIDKLSGETSGARGVWYTKE